MILYWLFLKVRSVFLINIKTKIPKLIRDLFLNCSGFYFIAFKLKSMFFAEWVSAPAEI